MGYIGGTCFLIITKSRFFFIVCGDLPFLLYLMALGSVHSGEVPFKASNDSTTLYEPTGGLNAIKLLLNVY
jgi:hypothetical protein